MQTLNLPRQVPSAKAPSAKNPGRWQPVLLWSDVIVFMLLGGIAFTHPPRSPIWWLGLTLALLAFAFWMIARQQLGSSFTATAQARHLVTTGLYRRFRHPIYLFGSLAHLGVFIALQNGWVLCLWGAYTLLIQRKRMRREERVLEEAFGDTFRNHRKSTWV